MNNQPPKLAIWLFEKLCGEAFVEDLRGDIDEIFESNSERKGRISASLTYWKQVISLSLSYALKKRKASVAYSHYASGSNWTMLRNYVKISLRNLQKQKTFTVLNILGLAMGMSIMMLCLAMYVDLLKFDEQHPNGDRIYRIITTVEKDGNDITFASSPPALANLIANQLPQVERMIPINDQFHCTAQTDKGDLELNGYVTTSDFLRTFEFPLASGFAESLNTPNQVIITHELALKLFGTDTALNQVIQNEKWGPLKVAGVLRPFPKHTHFRFDLLVGTQTIDPFYTPSVHDQWVSFYGNYFYFQLKENTNPEQLMQSIEQMSSAGSTFFTSENEQASYTFQAIGAINPNKDLDDDLGVVFEHSGFLLFFGISLLILLPACFNYTNMSIARALHRAKEIGIRKVIGSERKQVIQQFLIETIIVCLLATILSIYIFQLIKTEFTSMLAGGSSLTLDLSRQLISVFLGFGGFLGVLTGLIPAFYFARISPLSALKSNLATGKVSISGIRKGLLTAQFALTLIFMIGIGAMLQQYRLSLTHNLGFNKENILVVPINKSKQDLFKNTLLSNPDVKMVSFSSSVPGTDLSDKEYVYFKDLQDSMRYYTVRASENFISHMNLEMIWGKAPNPQNKQIPDVVVNEEFMKDIRNIAPEGDSLLIKLKDGYARISGVVKNYHHEPLNAGIYPLVLSYANQNPYALVSIASNDLSSTLESIEKSWDKVYPNTIFQASFLTQEIEKSYEFFRVALKIFGYLAFLAISISCLGLLGMVIYSTENRTKEVAIRKILGANSKELLGTLAGMFFKLWGIAIVIAVPIAYVFYDFALIRMYNKFSEGVGAMEIIGSVLVTVALGTLAILWQTNKIIQINPASNLRNE